MKLKRVKSLLCILASLALGCANQPVFRINPGHKIECYAGEPRERLGITPGIALFYPDPDKLGKHSYRFSFSEKDGLVYTTGAGLIDTYHLRENADLAAFLASETFNALKEKKPEFSFKGYDPSVYHVKIKYSDSWDRDKEDIFNASIKIGHYLAFNAATWHEIITGFRYKSKLIDESYSSFSWEDCFSNLLGTHIGIKALLDNKHEYDEAVDIMIQSEIKRLNAQPSKTAKQAVNNVSEKWFSGFLFFQMKKRNFDVNGECMSVLIPPAEKNSKGERKILPEYPLPKISSLNNLEIRVEIKPRIQEEGYIFEAIEDKKAKFIEIERHFPILIETLKKHYTELYGDNVDRID